MDQSPSRKSALQGQIRLSILLFPCIVAFSGAAPVKNPPGPADHGPTLVFPQFEVGQPIHLLAYGDTRFTDPAITTGTNPRIRFWLAKQIARQHPQAILLTGDTPFTGADPADWKVFQHETESWRSISAIQLPAIGNHDVHGGAPAGIANYMENFPDVAGNRYYSALLGSVEVISLDFTLPCGPSSYQGRWFAGQLDHIPGQVEFLMILHHLPWMADRQSEIFAGVPTKNALALRGMLEARLEHIRAKVIVFNGHLHNYERFERKGVEYVITGGGGALPYPVLFRGDGDLYRDHGFPVYHYLTVDVANHQLHAVMWKVKDPNSETLEVEAKDQFSIPAKTDPPKQPTRQSKPKARD